MAALVTGCGPTVTSTSEEGVWNEAGDQILILRDTVRRTDMLGGYPSAQSYSGSTFYVSDPDLSNRRVLLEYSGQPSLRGPGLYYWLSDRGRALIDDQGPAIVDLASGQRYPLVAPPEMFQQMQAGSVQPIAGLGVPTAATEPSAPVPSPDGSVTAILFSLVTNSTGPDFHWIHNIAFFSNDDGSYLSGGRIPVA